MSKNNKFMYPVCYFGKNIKEMFRNYLKGNFLLPSQRIPFAMDLKQGKKW